jgi:hypothetical protein
MQPMTITPIDRKAFAALSEPDPSALGVFGHATTHPATGGSGTGP